LLEEENMAWIDRPEVQITHRDGRLTAELRNGDIMPYEAYELPREGSTETICPTVDHIIAAAGW
jgi:hypothetical protein